MSLVRVQPWPYRGWVAQSVEREKTKNASSSISRGGAVVARLTHYQKVVGSYPTPATIDSVGVSVNN